MVEVPPRAAALRAGGAGDRVHTHTVHARQVDHHTAVADRKAWHTMAAATDRHDQVVGPGAGDCSEDISDAGTADNQRGVPVDHAIVNAAGAVVVSISGTEQRAAHLALQLLDGGRREPGRRAAGHGAMLVSHRIPPFRRCVAVPAGPAMCVGYLWNPKTTIQGCGKRHTMIRE